MNPVLYLLKVFLLSGLLYGYYWCFLQNRQFHGYNRTYLLVATAISLVFPLLNFPSEWLSRILPELRAIPSGKDILHGIRSGTWGESTGSKDHPNLWSTYFTWPILGYTIYLSVAGVFLYKLIQSIRYIQRLSGKYPGERTGSIRFFMTSEPGTPFSFLNSIYWNGQLDIESPPGMQVFRHELYHVRERHTLDVLFLELIRGLYWCNPFFYLILREITAIHEFLADRHVLPEGDKFEYAELLVWQTLRNHQVQGAHPFFHTHIKRRITMITKVKNKRPGHLSRIMALPLSFILFCAFAVGLNKKTPGTVRQPLKTITVIIDAGHGGSDNGAVSKTGVTEKDLVLAIAKKVKQYGPEYKVNVIMTREEDILPGNAENLQNGLRYRTDLANKSKADLFISLHTNAYSADSTHGFQVYVSRRNPYYRKCVKLGSAMVETLKNNYTTDDQLKEREQGVWVLSGSGMPAVLILCGNMDSKSDLAYIQDGQNQEVIARNILKGIVRYEQDGGPAR